MPHSLQTAKRGETKSSTRRVVTRNSRQFPDIDCYRDLNLLHIRCGSPQKGIIRPINMVFDGVAGIQCFNFKEAAYLVGKPLTELVKMRRGRVFGEDYLYKLGYTESVYDTADYDKPPTDQWLISKIWLSVGDNGEMKDQYYTEEHGTKVVSRIFLYTLQISYANPDSNQSVTTASSILDEGENEQNPKLMYNGHGRHDAINAIHTFCSMHPGRKLSLLNPEARKTDVAAQYFHITSSKVTFRNKTYLCIEAALCNALNILHGKDVADEVWNYLTSRIRRNHFIENEFMRFLEPLLFSDAENIRVRARESKAVMKRKFLDFRDASKFIQEQVRTLSLMNFKDEQGKNKKTFDFKMLQDAEDILLVSLESVDGYKHAVCIDSIRNIIIDSVEEFEMVLCEDVLESCVGGDRIFKSIVEVRVVRKLREKKDGRKARRGHKRPRRT